MIFKVIFLISFFFFNSLIPQILIAQTEREIPIITISPQAYSKTVIRVPNFEGDSKGELSSLLRNLLNLHLFCVALEEPPLPGFKTKEYYIKGKVETKEGKILFLGELIDTLENKPLKIYRVEGSSLERLTYALANQIIKDLSPYQGLSETKIAFVKRDSIGDHLYIMDFSKKNLRKIKSAELILFPKFSPSGKKLAYLIFDGKEYHLEISIFPYTESKKFKISGLSSAPLWMPNERELILTLGKEGEINIYLFDPERGELKALTSGKGVHQAGSVSPDGKWIAFVGDRTGKPQIYLLNLENKKIQRISSEGNYHTSPRFSPKEPLLIYIAQRGGKNELILYHLQKGEKRRINLPISVNDPALSPTGEYLIFSGKGQNGTGLYLIHLDSLILHPYLPFSQLYYPDWGKM